ncbi:MAG: putative ABC transport system ATP-binding protein [Pseudohongiellaceae bacterium]|jgi:putative ABC transport system ATP-binding protein
MTTTATTTNAKPSSAVSIEDVEFYWSKAVAPTLNIKEWHINKGQSVFLYGRSGSGKSTLLNIITGILEPQQGVVRILDQDITRLGQVEKDRFRARHMGVIFQQFNLIPYLSVMDNIQLSQTFSAANRSKEQMVHLVEQLGLSADLLRRKANQLSVGQQQRVAVARALHHQPEIIIADEPTSALDAETRDEFIELLLQQAATNNSAVLFVSHDKSLACYFDQSIDLQTLNVMEPHRHAV